MLAYLKNPISWRELFRRTVRETVADDAAGLAAELAYYFFLALFPALLALLALASLFPLQNFTDDVTRLLMPIAPEQVISLIREQMVRIASGDRVGLLSLGVAGALWSSSSAMTAVIDVMNHAYDVSENRPWWRVRLTGIALTIGVALFIITSLMLVLAGPELADWVAARLGGAWFFATAWKVSQWPIILVLVSIGIAAIYYFGPNVEQDWVWVTPGSILAAALWLAGSLAFRAYVVNFGNYDATYGAVGAMIVLMLWFYLLGFVIIIGAEINAEIEHASPWSSARPKRSAPRPRCKVGPAAAREWRTRDAHNGHPEDRSRDEQGRPGKDTGHRGGTADAFDRA
jgi:membrane protein